MYACGPTVYNYPHIGNMRRYIADDILLRVLTYNDYNVKHIMNITDVGHLTQDDIDAGDDKVLVAARREGKSPRQIAAFYTKAFLHDSQLLNLREPSRYVKATDHISEMQDLSEQLIEKGHAYEVDGNVYFDVQSFKKYGQLSGNTLDALKEKTRAELKDASFAQKKHPADFALWIKAAPDHILQWPSPWGRGYPGWHVECAAMILKHLAETIDIHIGGEDHIFPHHEDEIAEAEGVTGKPLANYWIHVRFLKLDGKKMAKREGSFLRLVDLQTKGFHPMAFRYLVLSAQFNSPMQFSWEALEAAQEGWERLRDVVARLRDFPAVGSTSGAVPREVQAELGELKIRFVEAINDNLGTPRALAVQSDVLVFANKLMAQKQQVYPALNAVLELLLDFDKVLGLIPLGQDFLPDTERTELEQLLRKREQLRHAKKYKEADAARDKVLAMGYELNDTPQGIEWLKKATGQHGIFRV